MFNKILIVVDMQNDFISGGLGSKDALTAARNVYEKISKNKNEYNQIFFTQDTHFKNDDSIERSRVPIHCIKDTDGWCINKDIFYFSNNSNVHVIEKNEFGYVDWKKYIPVIPSDYIEICGVCTDICVISNALILRSLYPNTKIICDAKCCAGTSPEKHAAALDVMESCLIDVIGRDV